MNNISLSTEDVIISKDLDLCEGCGKITNVIINYIN